MAFVEHLERNYSNAIRTTFNGQGGLASGLGASLNENTCNARFKLSEAFSHGGAPGLWLQLVRGQRWWWWWGGGPAGYIH